MTGVIAVLAGSASLYTGSATVTVGYLDNGSNAFYYGYASNISMGSIAPATWAGSNLPFYILQYINAYGFGTTSVQFSVTGNTPNSGWETMDIAGTTYSRSAASYSYNGSTTTWIWNAPSNPFGTTIGATKAVTWS